jgi:hypothetical protein
MGEIRRLSSSARSRQREAFCRICCCTVSSGSLLIVVSRASTPDSYSRSAVALSPASSALVASVSVSSGPEWRLCVHEEEGEAWSLPGGDEVPSNSFLMTSEREMETRRMRKQENGRGWRPRAAGAAPPYFTG